MDVLFCVLPVITLLVLTAKECDFMVKRICMVCHDASPPTQAGGHKNKNTVTTDREVVIEKRSICNDFQSWQ